MSAPGITPTPRPRRARATKASVQPVAAARAVTSRSVPVSGEADEVPGLQAMVNSQAVAEHLAKENINDILIGLESAAQFTDQIESSFSDMLDHVQAATKETARMAREAASSSQESSGGSSGAAVNTAYTARPMSPVVQTPFGGMTYDEGRQQGASIKSIGQAASNRMAQFISEHIPDPTNEGRYTQDARGEWHDAITGRFVTAAEATAEPSLYRRVAGGLGGRAAGALSALGGGEGFSGALGAVTKFAGPIGLGVGAATGAINFAESQRAANNYYVQALGTDQSGAFAERGREWLHGLTGLGTMGMTEAREQYKQVTALGLTGDKREAGLDFTSDLYKQYGMDTEQSVALLRMATENGTMSLDSLRDALEGVTKSAADAGENVSEAQQRFKEMVEGVTQGVTAQGTPAVQLSQGLTQLQSQFAHTALSKINLSGTLSTTGVMMAATRLPGQDPNRLVNQVSAGNLRATSRVLGSINDQFLDQALPGSLRPAAEQMLQAEAGDLPVTQDMADRMGTRLGLIREGIFSLIQVYYPNSGVSLPATYFFLFSTLQGRMNVALPEKASGSSAGLDTGRSLDDLKKGLGYTAPVTSGGQYARQAPTVANQDEEDLISAYQKQMGSVGASAQIESLLKEDQIGKSSQYQFRVQGSDGKTHYRSLEDILGRPDLMQQISGGTTVKDESGNDVPLSDITGLKGGGLSSALMPPKDAPKTDVRISTTAQFDKYFDVQLRRIGGISSAQRAGVPGDPDTPEDQRYSVTNNQTNTYGSTSYGN